MQVTRPVRQPAASLHGLCCSRCCAPAWPELTPSVIDWDRDFLPGCFRSAPLPQQQEATFLIGGNFGQSASVLLPVSPALVSACSYLSSHMCVCVPLILKLQGQELSWLLNSLFSLFFLFLFPSQHWKGQVFMELCLPLVDSPLPRRSSGPCHSQRSTVIFTSPSALDACV